MLNFRESFIFCTLKVLRRENNTNSIKTLRSQLELEFNVTFSSSLVSLFQNESKCETFHMKMSSACSFIFMQIKVYVTMGF